MASSKFQALLVHGGDEFFRVPSYKQIVLAMKLYIQKLVPNGTVSDDPVTIVITVVIMQYITIIVLPDFIDSSIHSTFT